MDVGGRLKEVRQNKGISIYKLAQDSGVSENHIRNLERGTKNATVATLEMLVRPLGIAMSEFFNVDTNIAYITEKEKILLDYFRTLTETAATAVIEFCEKLKKQ